MCLHPSSHPGRPSPWPAQQWPPQGGASFYLREKVPAPIPASEPPYHNPKQVRQPLATKADRQRQVLMRSGLFSGAGHLRGGDLGHKAHLLGRWGTHISKPISTSQCRQRFLQGGRGEQNRDGARELQSSLHTDKHSPLRQGQCWSGVRHPGLVTPASWLKVSKSPSTMKAGVCIF